MPILQALKHLFTARRATGPKILLVVAHPDDEYVVAATVYRITRVLNGTVDQFTITNGEGGFRYSQLAESIYGLKLTDETIGRTHLPAIRRRETLEAGKILGIREHFFLNQGDSHFNTDATEPLSGLWDRDFVSARLRKVLKAGQYQYVFVLLPTSDTHGHHQAAALLTTSEVMRLPREERPVVLGAYPAPKADSSVRFQEEEARYSVDRSNPITPDSPLTYSVVVNWVISAHKSQGLFQNETGKDTTEQFWILETETPDSANVAASLFAQLDFIQPAKIEQGHAQPATPDLTAVA